MPDACNLLARFCRELQQICQIACRITRLMLTTSVVFFCAFGLLLLLGRQVHRVMHALALVLTNNYQSAALLYALPLLPGVALHEISHALMAVLLRVKVRSFTLVPQRKAGSITLGSVEVNRADIVRMTLIGLAPMLIGIIVLTLIGWYVFDIGRMTQTLVNGDVRQISNQIMLATQVGDAFLWFYLMFAVANAMMPSASDTVTLPPVLFFLACLFGVVVAVAGIDWLRYVQPGAMTTMRWLSAVFLLTSFINAITLVPLWLLVQMFQKLTGRQVVY